MVIVVCAELDKSGFYRGKVVTDKSNWYMYDVALAAQNLVLAAHSLGLGTVHVGAFDAQKVARILEVPQGAVVVIMTPLGYPSRQGRTSPWKELSELVSYETFG